MDDCITLKNKPRKDGYVRTSFGGKHYYAHRYFYEKEHGIVPDGLEIDHLCENRACINTKHLVAVEHKQNMSHAKNRWLHTGFCKKGHDISVVGLHGKPPKGPTCRECKRENLRNWRKKDADK